MRAFGIFAAFAAITSVFALPAPIPASANAIKARDGDIVASNIANTVISLQNVITNEIVPQIRV